MPSTILITAANRGLGLEFTKQHAQEGWNVLACCLNPEKAKDLQALANNQNSKIKILTLDISNFATIDALAKELKNQPIDILLSNAGVYGSHDNEFGNIDYENWLQTFKINSQSALKLAEAFVENLEQGQNKCFVAITSKMGSISDNGYGKSYLYRSTKAALNAVVKSLSIDLKEKNIIAVVLHPGWVMTDMGGPKASTKPDESISGMRHVISGLKLKDSGKFFGYDGEEIPW